MDGTPIYDIKPYLPYTDCHPQAKYGFADPMNRKPLTVQIPERFARMLSEEQRKVLYQLLAQDPRPSYQNDPQRVYGMEYAQWEIKFQVDQETLCVCQVERRRDSREAHRNERDSSLWGIGGKIMANATLVIMAAGIGSRFGGGIKQLEAMGPNGEIIMDYSIYDAKEAGFDKVVFVIRKDLEKDFKEVIGDRIGKVIDVDYAYQELDDIPEKYRDRFQGRTKPWGTGQAILCCKDLVKEPFLVINADDYYGKEAYVEAYRYLKEERSHAEKMQIGMVGFVLGNTLSDNGSVTRGVCKVDANRMLTDIVETSNIVKTADGAAVETEGIQKPLDVNSPVSMNMWALYPEIFQVLETEFEEFLCRVPEGNLKAEYLLPTIIGDLLAAGKVDVTVLTSNDKWFGVTYKEDKETVVAAIRELLEKGMYPNM